MARPAEKARSMLNKWVAMREQQDKAPGNRPTSRRRPHLASECEHLADAERFRAQIVREIADAMAKIQNQGLGEHAIRELNDEINARMREKYHWNKRIYELGGMDYNQIEKQRQLEQGETPSAGYKYYGAAKDLPGVKELLAQQEAAQRKQQSQKDMYKNITPDYYGWRDEEDGVLVEVEALATKKNDQVFKRRCDIDPDIVADYLVVPSQEEINKALLEYKKKAMIERFNL